MSCNKLSAQKSPYLLQHKDNPVWWQAWGEEAFALARTLNRPIFLSIGYSTCYWCHVMEKDSFEKADVADLLNSYFVSIKVDREERPDVDQLYMDVVVGLTGHGGWPMSVFLTPDLKPFWGGTFFYREKFKEILSALHAAWERDNDKILASADEIRQALDRVVLPGKDAVNNLAVIERAREEFAASYDPVHGGFGGAPKFPPSLTLPFLLRIGQHAQQLPTQQKKGESDIAAHTLECMARGGIYDHLGGGFSRYSTDAHWGVPHFEKMLYDNALLAVCYLEGFQSTGNELFRDVAVESLEYLLREMRSAEGGFFSAQDAGDVGEEGVYYVWALKELSVLLTQEEFSQFQKVFAVSEEGNFEHRTNVLWLRKEAKWLARQSPVVLSAREKLRAQREKRSAPRRDEKILSSWNGLAISAFAKGYMTLAEGRYLEAAVQCANFILSRLLHSKRLLRSWCAGTALHAACADDYAALIAGLLLLYEADFNIGWLRSAEKLQALQDELLWHDSAGAYFYSEASELIVKKKDSFDNVTPSGNSLSLCNLQRMYSFFGKESYRQKYEKLKQSLSLAFDRHPSAVPLALCALDYEVSRPKEIVLVRKNSGQGNDFIAKIHKSFLPRKVFSVKTEDDTVDAEYPPLHRDKTCIDGKPTAYVCESRTCMAPGTDLQQVVRNLLHLR